MGAPAALPARAAGLLAPRPAPCCARWAAAGAPAPKKKQGKPKKGGKDKGPELRIPPLGPRGGLHDPIDDYAREGKRTPQQLLAESVVAKNYSRLKMAEEKRLSADRNRRIKLRDAAIAALPPELQHEALQRDYEDFPVWREPAGWEIVITYTERPGEGAADGGPDADAEGSGGGGGG